MIYLVRHGQTDWNKENRVQGQLDMPLNDAGKNEAAICAKLLMSVKIDRIVSSDLLRAKETANIINETLSCPLNFDIRLREINFGDLQGTSVKNIWDIFSCDLNKVHAEPLSDVYKRVKSFFDEIDTKENTLIITHGGICKMTYFLAHHPHSFSQSEFEKSALQFQIKNTEIFQWDKLQLFQPIEHNHS